MPPVTKDKLIKNVQAPIRIYPRSLGTHDVKRLDSSRKIGAKRPETKSIQTQTVFACVILNNSLMKSDNGTQTTGDIGIDIHAQMDSFGVRLVKFLGGKIFTVMKLLNIMR